MPWNRSGVIRPLLQRVLGAPALIPVFFALIGAIAVSGAVQGDFRFGWLGLVAALSYILIARDLYWGFFLLGVAWAISVKVPVPWQGLEYVVVRADDIVTLLLALRLSRLQQEGQATPWENSPVTKPMAIFLAIAMISMIKGLWSHCVDDPVYSFCNLLKWVEYFLLCIVAFQMKEPRKGMLYLLGGMGISTLVLLGFGAWEHFHPLVEVFVGNYYRLFERPPFLCQANHFGIFLALCLSFALPFFLWFRRSVSLFLLFGWAVAVSFVLHWTYSRMSYLVLVGSFAVLCAIARRWRLVLVALCVILAPLVLSERVWDRVVSLPSGFHQDMFSSSVTARIARWDVLWESVGTYPILGTGIGSRNRVFYESFWMQLLCETGLIGTALYLGILGRGLLFMIRRFNRITAARDDALGRIMLLGFFGVFVVMFFSAVTLVNFVITVTAAPFWTCFGFMLRESVSGEAACA